MDEKKCISCGKSISPPLKNKKGTQRKYCSPECRDLAYSAKYRENNPLMGTSSVTTGAISELRVAIDLLSKGYDVFRAVSPHCPCDLAILKNKQLLRIEVRTTHISSTGKPYKLISKHDDPTVIDMYAWVLPNEIIYEPLLNTL